MKEKMLQYILIWQGAYYIGTGLWAIVALDNFSRVAGHYGDPFGMYSFGGLAVVLGSAFLLGAYDKQYRAFAALLAIGSALAIIIPELFFFSDLQGTLFMLDLLEETAVVASLLLGLFINKKGAQRAI